MYTNLTLLNEEILKIIKEFKVSLIVQVISNNKEEFECISNKPLEVDIMKNIKLLKDNNVDFGIKILVCRYNEDNIENMISELSRIISTNKIQLDFIYPHNKIHHSPKYLNYIYNKKFKLFRVNLPMYSFYTKYNNCFGNQIALTLDGDILPCIMTRKLKLGSIIEQQLHEILTDGKYEALQTLTKDKIQGCKECIYRFGCIDCRAIEMEYSNTINETNYNGKFLCEKIPRDNKLDLNKLCSESIPIKFKSIYENRIDDKTEYVKLPTFNHPKIDNDFEQFLNESKSKNLIIDVRSNMGGLIEKAINVSSMLLKDIKNIGFIASRNEAELRPITINPTGKYLDKFKKIIILVDRNTDSSVENIFIRALKNSSNKIRILGTETMGLVHQSTVFTLKDNSQLQVTTSKYYDVNRNLLKPEGIEPDIFVENGLNIFMGIDNQLNMALKLLEHSV
ncbi:S41 family peptidase [Caloramator sp. mosi_1]|uniref:S41 family peptidase n=1 Tax=Caloramator sp. mosi_1 TaxID=3023090 RepID=UPI002362277E|nr:S41 family peptidase [Caloramator sp. mosi_1]WDC83407.1 S41 family peptidase [Caloramator sp. mosi_1]